MNRLKNLCFNDTNKSFLIFYVLELAKRFFVYFATDLKNLHHVNKFDNNCFLIKPVIFSFIYQVSQKFYLNKNLFYHFVKERYSLYHRQENNCFPQRCQIVRKTEVNCSSLQWNLTAVTNWLWASKIAMAKIEYSFEINK